MPVIARLDGVVVRMYYFSSEHNPPHVHVIDGDCAATVQIDTATIVDGCLPLKTMRVISPWISRHADDLLLMWETQKFKRITDR